MISELSHSLRADIVQYIMLGIVFIVKQMIDVPVCLDSLPKAPLGMENLQEICLGSKGNNLLFVYKETWHCRRRLISKAHEIMSLIKANNHANIVGQKSSCPELGSKCHCTSR